MDQPLTCKLKVSKDLDKTPAFLVDFSNGNMNLHNSTNKLKFDCYRSDDVRNGNLNVKRILVASSGFLNYKGERDESNDDRNKFNYFVGVRNKKSGRMKIYNSIPFHLKPIINSKLKPSVSEAKNFRERFEDLAMNFGSKEIKRALSAKQKYSTELPSSGNGLEDISLDDSIDTKKHSPSISNTLSNIDYLPPRNCEAQTADQVYQISSIISEEEDEYLDKIAEELLQDLPTLLTRWKVDGTLCEYVVKRLEQKELNHGKTKYLIYYNYLLMFSKLVSSDIKKKDPAPFIPEPVKTSILDRFTNTSSTQNGKFIRSFPQKMKDKLLAYMLVLALTIDDYYVNLAEVQKGTKYGLPKINTIAEALGCHIHRQKIDNCVMPNAVLKLPLRVPQSKYKKF